MSSERRTMMVDEARSVLREYPDADLRGFRVADAGGSEVSDLDALAAEEAARSIDSLRDKVERLSVSAHRLEALTDAEVAGFCEELADELAMDNALHDLLASRARRGARAHAGTPHAPRGTRAASTFLW